jgi:hypothetical protein
MWPHFLTLFSSSGLKGKEIESSYTTSIAQPCLKFLVYYGNNIVEDGEREIILLLYDVYIAYIIILTGTQGYTP